MVSSPYFTGEILRPPELRFNPSAIQAKHFSALQGLRLYGPYDSQRLGKSCIQAALIYPAHLSSARKVLVEGLTHGYGTFQGVKGLFRIPIQFIKERPVNTESAVEIQHAIRAILGEKPDIVILLTSSRNEKLYAIAKAELLGNGVPSQVITAEAISTQERAQWTLVNVALQLYGKIGGTPWTVMSGSPQQELVLGVSRALDPQRNMVVGFVSLFTYDGDYQFLYSLAPRPAEWSKLEEYREALAQLITDVFAEYQRQQGTPTSLVIHLCKRPGKYREIAAVETALDRVANDVPYALLHLNDDNNYRLFDAGHRSYVPESGIKVNLTRNSALLFLDGRPQGVQEGIRKKRGVPRVLEIVMDRRSTMSEAEFPRLVQQVFEFSRVNWRAFNAAAIPATLNYSYLVARLVAEVGPQNWNAIASAGALRDKAWFL